MSTTKPEETLPKTLESKTPSRRLRGAILQRLLIVITGFIAVFIAVLIVAGIQPVSPDPDSYSEDDSDQEESTHTSGTESKHIPEQKHAAIKSSQEADSILRTLTMRLRAQPGATTYRDVLAQLDKLIPSLNELDKKILFLAYSAKGDCEWYLAQPNDASKSYRECLELSKNRNDQLAVESAKPCLLLSFAELNRGDKAKAESYASTALKLTSQKNGTSFSLALPDYYVKIDSAILRSTCEDILANGALESGDYTHALQHAKSAASELGSHGTNNLAYCPSIIIADAYHGQGNDAGAKTELETTLQHALKYLKQDNTPGSLEETNYIHTCDMCAEWYVSHNYPQEAKLAYKSMIDLASKKKLATWLEQNKAKLKNIQG